MRIALVCALASLLSTTAEAGGFFRKGPYLQNPGPGGVTVVWEGEGARAGEVRLLGTEKVFRAELAVRQAVRIEGLEPGERHRYEVRAGDASFRGELQAAPAADASFSFAVVGNARHGERVRRLVARRVAAERPDFLLGAGNFVNDGLSEHDWQRLFEDTRELLSGVPLYPALGRHDLQGGQRSADNFRGLFELPADAPEPGRYYAFTYGPARFLVLDSNLRDEAMEAQTAWLEAELAAAAEEDAVRRIFAITHHAPYSVALHGGDERIRQAWAPLFESRGVDAVFSAHDHVYSRAEAGGVRYFVTGGGGARLYRQSRRADDASAEATRSFESSHHYLRVDVAHGLVEVSAVRLDGTIIETVRWGERLPAAPRVRAEVEDFLAPPEPARAEAGASEPAPSAVGEPRGEGAALGLGLAAFACLLAGGGAMAYARRRSSHD